MTESSTELTVTWTSWISYALCYVGVILLVGEVIESTARNAPTLILLTIFVVTVRAQTWQRPLRVFKPVAADDIFLNALH